MVAPPVKGITESTKHPGLVVSLVLGKSHLQDILTEVGRPSRIFIKNGWRILNYFHLGVDFICEFQTGRLKRMIFHYNPPNFDDFCRYKMCLVRFAESESISAVSQSPVEDLMSAQSVIFDVYFGTFIVHILNLVEERMSSSRRT